MIYDDWIANDHWLVNAHINDAYRYASGGQTLSNNDLATIRGSFLSGYWTMVSDPNVAYVNYTNNSINIGLQGFYNAKRILAGLFPTLVPSLYRAPQPLQVSEVVKVEFRGDTHYLYGFSATNTGRSWNSSGAGSGNYEVSLKVPAPASLLLLLIGALAALMMKRRRFV